MDASTIAGIATALGTVIAALGGAFSYYYNGKQKALQESAKLEVEKNNREIRDLSASNVFLVEEVGKIRSLFKKVSESYAVLVARIEELESVNKELHKENIMLRGENDVLREQVNTHSKELQALKKNLDTCCS